jgi:flagellar biosynthesis chaperone FliJ
VISLQQLWYERQSIDAIERTVDTGKQELECCRQRIEETKDVLVEKHRNVQLMEKHVGKLVDLDNKRILAVEQKGLDDITSMRFLRNRREGFQA